MAREGNRKIRLEVTRVRAWWPYCLAGVWLVFTLSLSGWWIIFGLNQIDKLMTLDHAERDILVRQQTMLLWEGATLFLSLALGGAALAYLLYRDTRRRRELHNFFATLTHELKTPLASLQLQAEALAEIYHENSSSGHASDWLSQSSVILQRLVAASGRLRLQLENALHVAALLGAQPGGFNVVIEKLMLSECLSPLMSFWPDLRITIKGDAILEADSRALAGILQNLIQNAVTHGKATEVQISTAQGLGGLLSISVKDNGKGFGGRRADLGMPFKRFYAGSGSGVGLYLCRSLALKMSAVLEIPDVEGGFEVRLKCKGQVVNGNTAAG